MFSLALKGIKGPVWVEPLLASVPGGKYGFLLVVNLVLLVLGFFSDFFELVFIIMPLIVSAADAFGSEPFDRALSASFSFSRETDP